MSEPLRLAFLGVDNPHGAGWRDLFANFESDAVLDGFVPGFGGAVASLEERFAQAPRFETVEQLLEHGPWDGAVVCLSNQEGPRAIEQLAEAGVPVLCEKPVAARRPLNAARSRFAKPASLFKTATCGDTIERPNDCDA